MNKFYAACFAMVLCTTTNQPVAAQGFTLDEANVRVGGSVGTSAQVSDQSSDVASTDLLVGPTVEALGRLQWRNADRDQLSLEAGLTTQAFPSSPDIDDLTASVFGEYRTNLERIDNAQLRLRLGVERNSRFPEERFIRYTAQTALNLRASGGPSATYILRYRYRDQNEGNSFDGFDQNEIFGSARYAWSFRNRALNQIAFTPFFDIRDAEADNFDYTEVGARLQARYEVNDDLNLIGRARYYTRNYEDIFSTAFPLEREDQRFTIEAELRKDVSESGSLFAAVGWDNNTSNIAVRDFDGTTFRVGFEFTLP